MTPPTFKTSTTAPLDDPPTLSALNYTTAEDTPFTTTAANNLASGAIDIDGGDYTYEVATRPTKGNVTITNAATGDFTYTPNANANGADSFKFVAKSGSNIVAGPQTASITISESLVCLFFPMDSV
jgi:hypothetical protein